jgi:hypothetical protein
MSSSVSKPFGGDVIVAIGGVPPEPPELEAMVDTIPTTAIISNAKTRQIRG